MRISDCGFREAGRLLIRNPQSAAPQSSRGVARVNVFDLVEQFAAVNDEV